MVATQPFGRTGHNSSRVLFGAAALGSMGQERADEILPILLENGINHIDTAASYGDSELRIGPWMQHHRNDFFLATKTDQRDGPAARAQLEASLDRLQTDHVDLIQLHNLVEEDEWQTAHSSGGAIDAMIQARTEGLVRHIGVTGHGVRIAAMHLRSLDQFEYDSVLLPYNYTMMSNPQYRADADELLARCAESGVAVQTIKSVARRRWADPDAPHFSWYEPLDDPGVIERAVDWVLADDRVFLNTSSDARLLQPIIDAAASPSVRPSAEAMDADVVAHSIRPIFDGAELERI